MAEIGLDVFMEQQRQRDGFKFGSALSDVDKRKLLDMLRKLENSEQRGAGTKKH